MFQRVYPKLNRSALLLICVFSLIMLPSPTMGQLGQNRSDERSSNGNAERTSFKMRVRAQVSNQGRDYLYSYTVERIDEGSAYYEPINSFSLVFPCGEEAAHKIRDLQSDGWQVEQGRSFSEPVLRIRNAWGLKFNPTYQLGGQNNRRGGGERTFRFSFISNCAPTRGQWAASGERADDYGDVDVPCNCDNSQVDNSERNRQRNDDYRDQNRNDDYIDRSQNRNDDRRDNQRNDDYNRSNNDDYNSSQRNGEPQLSRRDRSQRDNPQNRAAQITVTPKEIIINPPLVLKLRMETRLTSASARVGDRFRANLLEDLMADNQKVLPAGCKVEGKVISVTAAQRGKSGTIGINFDQLILPSGRKIQLNGDLTSLRTEERQQIDNEGHVQASESNQRKVVFIGGGAAGGAIIGAIAGGGKGAGIGAIVGAGAGLLGVLLTKGQEAIVEPGNEFGLQLIDPLRIPNAVNSNNGKTGSKNNDDKNDQFDRIDSQDTSANSPAKQFTTSDYSKIYADTYTIRRAQAKLKDLGYLSSTTTVASGRLTPTTRTALIHYQADKHLHQTGKVDYPTAHTLQILK